MRRDRFAHEGAQRVADHQVILIKHHESVSCRPELAL
jgi:hypothetical protein